MPDASQWGVREMRCPVSLSPAAAHLSLAVWSGCLSLVQVLLFFCSPQPAITHRRRQTPPLPFHTQSSLPPPFTPLPAPSPTAPDDYRSDYDAARAHPDNHFRCFTHENLVATFSSDCSVETNGVAGRQCHKHCLHSLNFIIKTRFAEFQATTG